MEIRKILYRSNLGKLEVGFKRVQERLGCLDEADFLELQRLIKKSLAQIKLLQNPEFISVHYKTGKWHVLYRQLKLELRAISRRMTRLTSSQNRTVRKAEEGFHVTTVAA